MGSQLGLHGGRERREMEERRERTELKIVDFSVRTNQKRYPNQQHTNYNTESIRSMGGVGWQSKMTPSKKIIILQLLNSNIWK